MSGKKRICLSCLKRLRVLNAKNNKKSQTKTSLSNKWKNPEHNFNSKHTLIGFIKLNLPGRFLSSLCFFCSEQKLQLAGYSSASALEVLLSLGLLKPHGPMCPKAALRTRVSTGAWCDGHQGCGSCRLCVLVKLLALESSTSTGRRGAVGRALCPCPFSSP